MMAAVLDPDVAVTVSIVPPEDVLRLITPEQARSLNED